MGEIIISLTFFLEPNQLPTAKFVELLYRHILRENFLNFILENYGFKEKPIESFIYISLSVNRENIQHTVIIHVLSRDKP